MRAATGQDVEIMLGVDGAISRVVYFFLLSSLTSSGKLEQGPLGISYVQESGYAYHGGFFPFCFPER